MQLENSFSVPVPVDEVWTTLLDVERIAPCMPGATVDRVDGDDITGSVKVKLGPIMMRYQGTMTFTEKDEPHYRAVLTARAKETRGAGSVAATISAQLAPAPAGTTVSVVTDLEITGKAAQFGRGVLADVSGHLVGQFAQNLATQLRTQETAPAPSAPSDEFTADASLNALTLLQAPARRLGPPVLAGLLVGMVIGRLTARHR
jgi:uncharacterized protein